MVEVDTCTSLESCLKHRWHIATKTYLDQPCLDVLIVKKLREDEEFLAQKLVREVDGSVHDSRAVSSDGVRNVTDVDGVQMFVVRRQFNENLK